MAKLTMLAQNNVDIIQSRSGDILILFNYQVTIISIS